jgi:predicted ATPase
MMVELGARRGICRYLTYLAEAQAVGGMVSAALDTVEEAIRANPQELAHQPETLRVRGDLHLQNGEGQSAESDYLDSISLAKKMRAKTWGLRATTSLARLLRDTNRRDEARAMLAEIYNWFTEGFDTADLKDAKALLDELDRIRPASS